MLDGAMTVEVGNQKSELKAEDILVINANKKHWLRTNDKDILYLRLGIAYQLVSDVFQSVDIIFWCDSSKENDKRYEEVRKVLKEFKVCKRSCQWQVLCMLQYYQNERRLSHSDLDSCFFA